MLRLDRRFPSAGAAAGQKVMSGATLPVSADLNTEQNIATKKKGRARRQNITGELANLSEKFGPIYRQSFGFSLGLFVASIQVLSLIALAIISANRWLEKRSKVDPGQLETSQSFSQGRPKSFS